MADLESPKRVHRPRQLILHATEKTYQTVDRIAHAKGTTKSAVLREIFNAGVKEIYGRSAETSA